VPNSLKVSRGQDYVSHVAPAVSVTASSYAFVPQDNGQTGTAAARPILFAEELIIHNLDATNNAYIRLATAVNTPYVQGAFPVSYGTSGTLFTVDTTKFVAATSADIVIPAGVRGMQVYVKCLGFSIISTAGTPIVDVTAFGSLGPIS
jgi:hypothetical protein